MQVRNLIRFAAAGVLSSSLIAGCATVEEDFAVDSTMAPLVTVPSDVAIANQYIVVFKDTVGEKSLNAAMNNISFKDRSSRIEHRYTIIPGFSARLSASDLDAVRRNPDVAFVEQDQLMFAAATKPSSGQLELARHDACPAAEDNVFDDHNCNGSGTLVYVVDTGIRATHNDFGGRVNTGRGFTAINDGRGTTDCNGHGTHVASTAAGTQFGMASGATLVPVRVLGCDGSGSNSGVINGVNHVRNNCQSAERCVANMSLGGGISSALDNAVTAAVNAGIPFAVAAGNSNANVSQFSPARAPAAITVGCASDTGYPASDNSAKITRCSFSNFGAGVDIWASGLTILGADDGSNTATQTISGTSMSSPHVAGAIAQLLSCQGDLSPAQVEAVLDSSAISGAMSSSPSLQGAQNLFLCSDFDGGADACSCGGGGGPGPIPGGCIDSNACGGEADNGCFCDNLCIQFGDCCPDGPC